MDLTSWPGGMRLILRKERPHPGAQLRFTDADGLRLTAFVTNTRGGQLADLELRHRRRARCEDRIRVAVTSREEEATMNTRAPAPAGPVQTSPLFLTGRFVGGCGPGWCRDRLCGRSVPAAVLR